MKTKKKKSKTKPARKILYHTAHLYLRDGKRCDYICELHCEKEEAFAIADTINQFFELTRVNHRVWAEVCLIPIYEDQFI